MLKKYKFLVENGISEMICSKIGDYILVYGGNNFPDGTPPNGSKKIYNKMYLFDNQFELVLEKEGSIFPNAGITISDGDKIFYILNDTIYLIELNNKNIIEKEYFKLPFSITYGFGCKFENYLFFGHKEFYKLSITNKTLSKLTDFPDKERNQSLFAKYDKYLYIFGGASDICHMDSYKYDLTKNIWYRLADIPVSFTGASSVILKDKLLILGGFNKKIYDNAVQNLADINFKINYFKKDREEFLWNQNQYIYDFKNETFEIVGFDKEGATCGSGLIQIKDKLYLIGGELKPGFRNEYIFKDDLKI